MEFLLSKLHRVYTILNYEWSDPRAEQYILVMRPFSVLALMAAYTLFVTRIGPHLMRDRKPFKLKGVLVVYNTLQIIFNAYLFYGLGTFWFGKYNWRCEPIDRSNSPDALQMVHYVYLYFLLKIFDLFDTVFFVLRKKNNQITFLHIYHHSLMVQLGWQGLKYLAGGHGSFLGFINTFVHVVMYTYYLVSSIYNVPVRWKKLVTQIQLVQHCLVGLHEAQLLVHNPCGYSMYPPLALPPQALLMVILFLRFYHETYGPNKGRSAVEKKENGIKID